MIVEAIKEAKELRFLSETHQYFLGDVEVDHVTGVLEELGLSDYSHVPYQQLEWAKKRGTAVHLACQYYDEGDLDESTLHPEVLPRLEAWKRFRSDSGFQADPGGIERQVFSENHGLAGKIDRVGILDGPSIVDIKTSAMLMKHWGLQLAAYEFLEGRFLKRYTVRVLEDGTYRVDRFRDPNDRRIFLAALSVAQWKRLGR
ncbi:MAG: hypothetical protein U1E51_27320 [Candidatus Binatia bacterium]|nr:hypothetical protein [Candidatus Binatia bacterium]